MIIIIFLCGNGSKDARSAERMLHMPQMVLQIEALGNFLGRQPRGHVRVRLYGSPKVFAFPRFGSVALRNFVGVLAKHAFPHECNHDVLGKNKVAHLAQIGFHVFGKNLEAL